MSDPKRHTRVTAELAAHLRPTHKILKQTLVALVAETVPEDGIFDVEALDAPASASNMHVRRGPGETTDHRRPTVRMKTLVRLDE